MNSLLKQHVIQLGFLALVSLMLATRIHYIYHFGSTFSLPDASLAVFFLAGFYFNRFALFVLLLFIAAMVDYVAISQLNVSDWCISPAYIGLIPTYALVWLAGNYSARIKWSNSVAWVVRVGLLFLATSGAFFISNTTFYLFSGRYAQMAVSFYTEQVMQYYSPYLTSTLLYSVLIMASVKLIQVLNQYQQVAAKKTDY